MIEERRLVLHVAEANVATDDYGGIEPTTITLDVAGSDLMLLLVEQPEQGSAFADLCSGILAPSAGVVQFLGSDWSRLEPDISNALRGRIGRVFHAGGWVNQLSMLDNVLLQQLHHTRDALENHRRRASGLARRFGLPGVPLGHPQEFAAADLRRAACVRAFLGQPELILLEEPTRGLAHGSKSRLIHVIREARDRGAAVVWITVDHALWQDGSIPSTRRCRWVGRELIEVGKKR